MNQDDIVNCAEILARHLHEIRLTGRPCPTNIIATAQAKLKCTRPVASAVKHVLVETGRLQLNPIRKIFRIDGKDFSQKIEGRDPLDALKKVLMRRYNPVFDPRTSASHLKTPSEDGKPTHLVVGTQLLTIEQAVEVAKTIEARAH